MSDVKPLALKMQLFVDEYIIDFDRTAAAIRAGYSPKTAKQQAYRITKDPRVDKAIDEALAARAKRCHITADHVLLKWWDIANADPNELASVRRVACGFCHGDNLEVADGDDFPAFIIGKDINPDCPACAGDGEAYVHIADTTNLSPSAKLLFQGAENTKFGIKVNIADQSKALENVARHLGMFKDQVEHTGKDGADLFPSIVVRYE